MMVRVGGVDLFRAAKTAPIIALGLLILSCASPAPRHMLGDESFATVYTVPVNCLARGACVSRVTIMTIDGKSVGHVTTKYNYRVLPGEHSIIVLAYPVVGDKMKFKQGVCELKWTAVAGKLYEID
ncbi:MAG TPA: hypothetical protein VNH64_08000, partial [Parvularculaceae bacterium]|nr:hypothetical protein [Parvularculaceae bacterium]